MRLDRFTFLINADERRMIAALAARMNRSQGDAVRTVIRDAVRAMEANHPTTTQAQHNASGQQAGKRGN